VSSAQVAVAVYEVETAGRPATHPLAEFGSRQEMIGRFVGQQGETAVEWLIWQAKSDRDGLAMAQQLSGADAESGRRLWFSGYGSLLSRRPWGDVLLTAPYLMPVPMNVPPDQLSELDRWYEEEHVGLLLRCPDWLQVLRYELNRVVGPSWNRLALHPLTSPTPFEHTRVQEAISTPWRLRLAAKPWFLDGGRVVLERQDQSSQEEETTAWQSPS